MTPSDESRAGGPLEDAPEDVPGGELRIAKDGTWFHAGSPIRRTALVKLFASVLKRDEAGNFWLQTPVETCPIAVEDAPFVAVEMEVSGESAAQRLDFRSNLDVWIEAGPEHPLRIEIEPESGEPRPYVLAEPGPGGGLEALLLRPVFYRLAELAVPGQGEHAGKLGVWSRGAFFVLGPLSEAGER